MSTARLIMVLSCLNLLAGCHAFYAFSERPSGPSPSYSDAKKARENAKKPSPEELDQLMAECPKPNGVFQNEALEKGGIRLASYFLVPGFETPATSYPGGRSDDAPLDASASPINLLGGIKNSVRQSYYPQPSERFTLELRPLRPGRFRIGVKGTSGRSGDAEGFLNLSGERKRCENGALKAFWTSNGKTFIGWELFVEAESGDIVVHSSGGQFYGGWHEEHYTRFKRTGN